MKKKEVSIIIVFFRDLKKLVRTVESVKKHKTKYSTELIVVDNSEREDVELEVKKVKKDIIYIKSLGNIGYGAGNNLGAKRARGEYLFILNPDTQLQNGAIDTLTDFLNKKKKCAIVAPNLVDKDGKVFKHLGSLVLTPLRGIVCQSFINKLFPKNPISRKYFLYDLSIDTLRKVNVVPGSAFLVRKDVFEKVGMFDKNIFLFFEESDLGKRIKDAGYEMYINPKARVEHDWTLRKGSRKLRKILENSRFYYFKKHYGIINAVLVETIARFSKWHAALLLMTLIGIFLRFYKLEANMDFHGEIGHNYLAVKDAIQSRNIPLLGPPTSHSWLSFGPLFYWLFMVLMGIFGYNPIVGAVFMAFVGTLVVPMNYFIVQKYIDKKVALISSIIIALSPAWLVMTRASRFFSLVITLFYPFIYFLLESKKKKKNLVFLGLVFGVMLNFHLTPLIFLPAVAYYLFKEKLIDRSSLFRLGVGFLIPTLPLLISDMKNGFEMILKLVIWVPYRIAGFTGLYPKNNVSMEILKSNFASFGKFVSGSVIFNADDWLVFLISACLVLYVIFYIARTAHKNQKYKNKRLIFSILIIGVTAIFIHGDPPIHYYYPLYPVVVITLAVFFSEIVRSYRQVMLFFIVLFAINMPYYFSSNWFYKYLDLDRQNYVSYETQKTVSRYIVGDASNGEFSLERVGHGDEFGGHYAQNYQYLMWIMGNEPVSGSEEIYMIVEGRENLKMEDDKVKSFENVFVYKK